MEISIRRITSTTDDCLCNLITFGRDEYKRTFGHLYTDEQLSEYLASAFNVDMYNSWITKCSEYGVFVAFENGCDKIPDEYRRNESCEIKRIYVSSSQTGTGLAGQLLLGALEFLGPSKSIFLGVFVGNHKARRFYEKYGFVEAGRYFYPMIGVEMLLMEFST